MALLLALVIALSLPQLSHDRDPNEASRLRPNELVRLFKRGGLTIDGPYAELVVVRSDGTAIVKTPRSTRTWKLDSTSLKRLKDAVRGLDRKMMEATPNTTGLPPSASDRTDLFLAVRQDKKVYRWTNLKFERPLDAPLLDLLDEIHRAGRQG